MVIPHILWDMCLLVVVIIEKCYHCNVTLVLITWNDIAKDASFETLILKFILQWRRLHNINRILRSFCESFCNLIQFFFNGIAGGELLRFSIHLSSLPLHLFEVKRFHHSTALWQLKSSVLCSLWKTVSKTITYFDKTKPYDHA